MKILLPLPLLVLLGCALAEEHNSVKTCTNGNCIDCVNGVCTESREKRDQGVYSSSTSSSSSNNCVTYNGKQTCSSSSLNCHNGDCTESKREISGVQSTSTNCETINGHEKCTVCVNGDCHVTERGKRELPNCYEFPWLKECPGHNFPHLPDCYNFPDDARCHEQDKNVGSHQIGLPNCLEYPNHPRCKRRPSGDHNIGLPDCLMYPDFPACKKFRPYYPPNCVMAPNLPYCKRKCLIDPSYCPHEDPLIGLPDCLKYPDFPSCKRIVDDECARGSNHIRCHNLNQLDMPNCYENPNDPRCRRGKRESGTYSKNCVNNRCQECINGVCKDVQNHKREAQNHSSSENCINGKCTKCTDGVCETYQQ